MSDRLIAASAKILDPQQNSVKTACLTLSALAGVFFILGFLGHLHPIFDALTIGRWIAIYVLLLCLFLLVLLNRRYVLAALALAALVLVVANSRVAGDGEAGNIRVYTKNLWHGNVEITALAADIANANPDIVVLQEVSENNVALMSSLQSILPHQARCPWQGWNGIAILSRRPLSNDATRCSPERSLMVVKVIGHDGPFWVVGVHLQQPWPDVQWAHLERALPVLSEVNGNAIVAGDFNTVPWSAAAKTIGHLTNTKAIPPRLTTFRLWGVGLPLDQIWALGGKAELRPMIGSDHYGVVADVWPSNPTARD